MVEQGHALLRIQQTWLRVNWTEGKMSWDDARRIAAVMARTTQRQIDEDERRNQ